MIAVGTVVSIDEVMASLWWRRRSRPSRLAASLLVITLCLCAPPLHAQVRVDLLHAFSGETAPLTMSDLSPLVQGSDGNFYFGTKEQSALFG